MRVWILLLLPVLLLAQVPAETPAPPADTRAADLLAELSKTTYVAKRDIPASENIFVENGSVVEALYVLTKQENPVAVKARQVTSVSKVMLMDKAIHVFFAEDKCALLIIAKENQNIADMTLQDLVQLARKGIAALFTAKEAAKPAT